MRDDPQSANSGFFVGNAIDFTSKQSPIRPGLQVPWSWLSLGLLTVTIMSLGTLSVVVGIKDVDILSTIALALAVLAFAAQLIVSLAQAQGSAQQLTQTERVNSETRSALAEVKSTANALLTNQSDQFNQVLSALLRSATEDAVREAAEASSVGNAQETNGAAILDPEAVAEQVEERVRKLLSHQSSSEVDGVRSRLISPISESVGISAFALYRALSPAALLLFINISHLTYPSFARTVGFKCPGGRDQPALQELVSHNILRVAGHGRLGVTVRPTNTGRSLALLIFGEHFDEGWYWSEMNGLDTSTPAAK
ncbi:hypothetical protein ACWEEK_33255 [Micromonospora aurantiaca (nom. illeg.)]